MNGATPGTSGTFPPLEPPRVSTSKRTKWAVLVLILIVCATPGLALYWLRQHYRAIDIPAGSMEPTIRTGERILVDMDYFKSHAPARGDITVIDKDGLFLEKRVVALPGDTIEGRNDLIYLNGKVISEPYMQHIGIPSAVDVPFLHNFGPITLKVGECFVLGDNRDNSFDSRDPDFGSIPVTSMIGRPLYVLVSKERDRAWKRIQ